jgi:hypothetical protein
MKRVISVVVTSLAGMLIPMFGFADGLGLGIEGSPHDFSAEAWNFRGEICRVCHVPHDHDRNEVLFEEGLLWNHTLSTATYQMYAEGNPDNPEFISFIDGAFEGEPMGISKLCLGCHDDTVALNQFDRNFDGGSDGIGPFLSDGDPDFVWPGPSINDFPGGVKNLLGTHPISITYDDTPGLGMASVADPMGTSGTIADVLDNGRVQCSSCHDVHDSPGESVGGTHLLRVLNNGANPSGLCLTCHVK